MMKSEGQKAAVVDINPIVVLVIVSVRYDQYDDQHTNYKGIKEKFLISQEIRNFLAETTGLEPVTSCV